MFRMPRPALRTPMQPVMPGALRLHPSLEPSHTAPKERSEAHDRKAICSHVVHAMQVSSWIIREAPGISSILLMAGPKFGAFPIRQRCRVLCWSNWGVLPPLGWHCFSSSSTR